MMKVSLLSALAALSVIGFPVVAKGEDLSEGLLKTIFQAETYERQRTKFGRLHGRITIDGQAFDFATGGRGRGSAPFGTYTVGRLGGFTVRGGKGKHRTGRFIPGFPLSDAYDPLVKDRRDGLYIHPGHGVSAGCFAIRSDEWPRFVRAMQSVIRAGKKVIVSLMPGEGLPKEQIIMASTGKHARHRLLKVSYKPAKHSKSVKHSKRRRHHRG